MVVHVFTNYSLIIPYLYTSKKELIWGHGYAACNYTFVSQMINKLGFRLRLIVKIYFEYMCKLTNKKYKLL